MESGKFEGKLMGFSSFLVLNFILQFAVEYLMEFFNLEMEYISIRRPFMGETDYYIERREGKKGYGY